MGEGDGENEESVGTPEEFIGREGTSAVLFHGAGPLRRSAVSHCHAVPLAAD